ncbi:MAG: RNA polymerase sigma factor [Gammaproteobacteria bacterium]|nr:RNA polymerase sigma factor [Gammaproteobacteria bacterium]QOJ32286.1 MAG: RNA polymerase sigma factor [Gammaproteobacteria bacterium]
MQDEQQLLRRMLAGDERAFSEFFNEYFARLYRFALPRLNGNADVAQEVVQATLCKVMRRLDTFRGEAALFTWICQICRHQIADYLRENRRHTERVVLIDDSPAVQAALDAIQAPDEERPEQHYGRGQTAALVRAVLDRLPARYGDALEWKYVEGLSVEEIGARMGVGTTAAQSLLARARVAFRDAIEQVFGAARAAEIIAGENPGG